MTRILITGAGGLVATALARRFEHAIARTHAELDVTDRAAVFAGVRAVQPAVIVNCAVLGVDECEADPQLAEAVNVRGPALLAEAAEETGAALVHFSSNYVLDPVNVYARTKLEGERAAAARCARSTIIRTSWVFGPGKDSFVSAVHRRLMRGERVRAVIDVFASATYVEHLAARVEEIVRERRVGRFDVANAGVCSHETFAMEAARIVRASPDLIDRVRESEMRRAPRPPFTPLFADPPLPDWREALAEYIGADIRCPRA